MTQPPKKIYIMGQEFVIDIRKGGDPLLDVEDESLKRVFADAVGAADHTLGKIMVREYPKGQSLDSARDTILHEIVHISMRIVGAPSWLSDSREEDIVSRISPVILDTLRRNPRLSEFLLSKP